ncbi:GNAT family N-acetyltransferase [Pseudoalteromonas luteoviolacea]|uniref:GNAT family N-acetyltransferase n=1 Tax=Pseudoalteromonas luteoviolacea TaxID=43657 RepID=UPI001B366C91|nr:GNAT family N-acetyltransferase [Pseudoalteromonas luteoviolacea]MBQ4835944.1 GNAT family N-acetyltransferase [Pseudoalteromonas luteoviolacea]
MIRAMTKQDFREFWPVFKDVILQQETYAFDPQMDENRAYQIWCEEPIKAFVYEDNGQVMGSYYLKANAMGPSDHICNCGYMVSPQARGKGVARKLCEHSQQQALFLGFRAMQFNSVVSSNQIAVALWEKLGYEIIGTIPKAYRHPHLGLIDSYIMYKWLE